MVQIAPFKGVMYKKEKLNAQGADLIAPPYDVLSEEEQLALLDKENNILNLDYNHCQPGDKDKHSWHERSGHLIKKWLEEGILTRLDSPAIFHIQTICPNPIKGGHITRHGFICLMKLEDFSPDSQVRPHEKTFSSHKEERFDLMKNTSANLSQVFGFFPDDNRQAIKVMNEVMASAQPDIDFKDHNGFTHRMWINKDAQSIAQLQQMLLERRVYIADGHHRYETALNYSHYLRQTMGDRAPSSGDYVMIYLCPMSDPGLVILPTHRLLHYKDKNPDEILNILSKYFKISGKSFSQDNMKTMRERFASKLRKNEKNLGLYISGRQTYYVLKPLDSVWHNELMESENKALSGLDTIILNNIVFRTCFDLSEKDMDNPDIISYISNFVQALDTIDISDNTAAFILNPSRVEDILRVTESGQVMPRKSTFFYPKVTTGLVFNIIDSETLG